MREGSVRVEETGQTACSSWVVDMERMIANTNGPFAETAWKSDGPSIYRVPDYIKKMTNPDAYQPQVVSLGPFHHGERALLPMEPHKRRAVAHMVKRSGKLLQALIAAVEEIAEQLQSAYDNLDEKWHGERFVELMVTDGCFLLEIMRTFEREGKVEEDYGPNDPVFSKHGYLYLEGHIISDVLLIENQLPMLLLQKLITCVAADANTFQINNRVLDFLGSTVAHGIPVNDQLVLHPLDIVQKSISGNRRHGQGAELGMPSATELHDSGIHFKLSKAFGITGAISFERGVLSIPRIFMDDSSERVFLNLTMFERLHPGGRNDVTAFLIFMDYLINTAKDVALLKSQGIIKSCLGSDEVVADLFNTTLTKGTVMGPDSNLQVVIREVNAHCKKPWNKWRASLIHTYFSNPWVFTSLVAAIILLVATVMQTVYTVVPFYRNK